MAPHTVTFAVLSDDELVAEVHRLAAAERCATGALIRSLIELDRRPHLYLRDGCSSLFVYCTRVLRLAEGSAYNRIEVARAARRFPVFLEALEQGALTLTAVRLLAPHVTEENHRDVLATARFKSKSDVERLVSSLRPRPDVPPIIRKLPEPRSAARRHVAEVTTAAAGAAPVTKQPVPAAATVGATRTARAAVTPLSTDRYKVEFTVSADTRDKLRRAQDLLRHAVPSGDLAEILDRALVSLLSDLERRQCAATSLPREARKASPGSRHIPAAVRREVSKRDDGRCAFVGRRERCTETSFLEFHHVAPYAGGGEATVENIQLRCRAHNQYEARLYFGSDPPHCVREMPAQWQRRALTSHQPGGMNGRRSRRAWHAAGVDASSSLVRAVSMHVGRPPTPPERRGEHRELPRHDAGTAATGLAASGESRRTVSDRSH